MLLVPRSNIEASDMDIRVPGAALARGEHELRAVHSPLVRRLFTPTSREERCGLAFFGSERTRLELRTRCGTELAAALDLAAVAMISAESRSVRFTSRLRSPAFPVCWRLP